MNGIKLLLLVISYLIYSLLLNFIGSNLIQQLKLLFCLPITTNNNLPLKICCENVVYIAFFFEIMVKRQIEIK